MSVHLLKEVGLGYVLEFEEVCGDDGGEDCSKVGDKVFMPCLLIFDELFNGFFDCKLKFRVFLEAVEIHGVNVYQDSDDSNGGVFLLIHHVESDCDEQFGEDLENELWLEVLGGVCHDHRKVLLKEVEESALFVISAKVNRHPMCDFFIVGSVVDRLLNEGFDGDVVEEGFSLLDGS